MLPSYYANRTAVFDLTEVENRTTMTKNLGQWCLGWSGVLTGMYTY